MQSNFNGNKWLRLSDEIIRDEVEVRGYWKDYCFDSLYRNFSITEMNMIKVSVHEKKLLGSHSVSMLKNCCKYRQCTGEMLIYGYDRWPNSKYMTLSQMWTW